jgi:DNA-directed RNA polymerase specialized sigma subunit
MSKKNDNLNSDDMLNEIRDIKRLLIFGLLRSGVKQEDIGNALGVSQSTISKMFPHPIDVLKKSKRPDK